MSTAKKKKKKIMACIKERGYSHARTHTNTRPTMAIIDAS